MAELTRLFSMVATFPEDRTAFHNIVLEAALRIVPAKMGTIWFAKDGKLSCSAAVGHDLEKLKSFSIDADDLIGCEVVDWNGQNGLANISSETRKALIQAHRPRSKSIQGSHRNSLDQTTLLSLDLPSGSDAGFSDQDRLFFHSLLDLIGAYEEIHRKQTETRTSQEKIRKLLDLIANVQEMDTHIDRFLFNLLESLLSVVEEADYGSVALGEGGSWRFVASVGHDLTGLKKLKIPKEDFLSSDTVSIIKDLLHNKKLLKKKHWKELKNATLPISRSMILNLEVALQTKVHISLDIKKGSKRRFRRESEMVIDRFVKLASAFLRMRMQKEVVERAYRNLADKIAVLAEAHDKGTSEHNARVANLSAYLAKKYGMGPEHCEKVRRAAVLHDVGKLFINPSLLNKTGSLSEEDKNLLKQHTLLARKILDDPFFELEKKIAAFHHERYDGKGYPFGLSKEEIPIEAQIVSVSDVYDALRSQRSYKPSYSPRETLEKMRYGDDRTPAGGFNPVLLAILEDNVDEIERIWSETA